MEAQQTIYLEFADRPSEMVQIAPDCTGHDLCALIAGQIWLEAADSLILVKKLGDVLLDLGQTLRAQNVGDGERLLVLRSRRRPLSGKFVACLREAEMGDVYPIQWQPALIGRPGHRRDKELLAANLEWLPDGLSISRNHAFIYERNGHFFIRHIAGEHNQTAVNGQPLGQNENCQLNDGDTITLGRRRITLNFLLNLAPEIEPAL